MKGDKTGALRDGIEQRREIGVAQHDLGIGGKRAVVENIQDAHRSVAASQRENRPHLRIASRFVEIRGTLLVTSGKVAVFFARVPPYSRNQSQRSHNRICARELFFARQRAGRRDESDRIAIAQSARKQLLQRRSSTRSG